MTTDVTASHPANLSLTEGEMSGGSLVEVLSCWPATLTVSVMIREMCWVSHDWGLVTVVFGCVGMHSYTYGMTYLQ